LRSTRSFRRAAAALGVTPSSVSQAIRALEARVGAALLARTTRSVGLTEAGERFLSRAKPAFEELVAAGAAARDLGQRPTGLLRLSMPRAIVPLIVEPVIASFSRAYPEIELEIAVSAELVDLVAGGFDAGIRLGQLIAPDMVAVRLTPPFPLANRRQPRLSPRPASAPRASRNCATTPACAAPPGRIDRAVSFIDGNRTVDAIVAGPLIAHDYPTLLGAAIRGVGLLQLPGRSPRRRSRTGALQAVLTPFAVTLPGVFLCHAGRRQVLPKLRAFHRSHQTARRRRTAQSDGRAPVAPA